MAHMPIRALLTQPKSISLATSMIATGTPWEWQAIIIKSAFRISSIQLSSSFHNKSMRSAILPSPSKAAVLTEHS